MRRFALALGLLACCSALLGQGGEAVLLVVNRADPVSRRIADYYIPKRGIPLKNVCKLDILSEKEEIDWDPYVEQVERPIARCLAKANLREQVLYIVTTMGVPLKAGFEAVLAMVMVPLPAVMAWGVKVTVKLAVCAAVSV